MSRRHLGLLLVGALLLVVSAKAVSRFHWEPGVAALAGHWVPPDLGVFLAAGDDVLHGRNPYLDASTVGTEFGYVYPPLVAWVISPLSALPGSAAATIWTMFMIGCLLGALWLLGVRDWRCYAVAVVLPFSRAAFEYGAIGPLLVLLVAATWRNRDRSEYAALTTAAAIATKLFLWPLAVWFLVTGRQRTGALTIAATLGLVLAPWAAIGFAGLMQYPELLDKVAERQDHRSFSVIALARGLGSPPGLAGAISITVGVTLIVLAVWTARRTSDPALRDYRSLSLFLAASLALTPIVWSHYLVLLLIPTALARPRFSGLWLFLLSTTILDAFSWYRASPDGDALALVAVAAIVSLVLVTAVRSDLPQRPST